MNTSNGQQLVRRQLSRRAAALRNLLQPPNESQSPVECIIIHCDGSVTVVPVGLDKHETALLLLAFLICSGSISSSFWLTDDMRAQAIRYFNLEHLVASQWPSGDQTMRRPLRSKTVLVTLKLTKDASDYLATINRHFLLRAIEYQLACS